LLDIAKKLNIVHVYIRGYTSLQVLSFVAESSVYYKDKCTYDNENMYVVL